MIIKPKKLRVDTWEMFLIEHFKKVLTKDEILELLPDYELLLRNLVSPGSLGNYSDQIIIETVNRVFDVIKYPDKIKTFDEWINLEHHWMDLLAEKHGLQKTQLNDLLTNDSKTYYHHEIDTN